MGGNKTKISSPLPKINLVNMTLEPVLAGVPILKCVVEAKAAKYLLSSRSKECYVSLEHQVLSLVSM